jgi:hypothetical protein
VKIIKLLIFIIMYGTNAQAKDIDLTFTIYEPNLIYSCSYVERVSDKLLLKLGARNIKSQCLGGYPYSSSNTLKLSFAAASIEDLDADWEFISWKSRTRDSCSLELRILEKLFPHLEIADISLKDRCRSNRGYYFIDLIIYSYFGL